MPDLRGPEGVPTGAIHGMVAMLQRALKDVKPEHAVCVFDAHGPDLSQRLVRRLQGAAQPDAGGRWCEQIEPIHEVVRLLGWPVLVVPGIEADDAIGTLAQGGGGFGSPGGHLHRRQGPGAAGQRAVSR